MSYGNGGGKFGGKGKYTGGRNAATSTVAGTDPISERKFNLAVKPQGADKYVTLGNIEQYLDSGHLRASINMEEVSKLAVNDRGWINGIAVFPYTPKPE